MEFDALHAIVGTGGAPSAAREAILKEPEGGMIVEDDTDNSRSSRAAMPPLGATAAASP